MSHQIKVSPDFFEPHQRLLIKKHFDVKDMKKILVQGIDQLGGLMLSTPFFRELRRAFPEAYIVNLVGPLTYGIMQNCPYVDEVWLFNKKESLNTAFQVRKMGFDLSFLPAGTMRAALIALLGGVKHRVGYDTDGTGKLLTVQLHQELFSRYRPENIFDFLRAIGLSPQDIYEREVWFSEADRGYAKSWYKNFKGNKKILAFNPFSTDPKRRWTDEGWKGLLLGLRERNITPIMLVAPNEVDESIKLLMEWGYPEISVQTHTVTQTGAILEYVDFVCGPESGFMHMGLAVNKPHVIGLFNVVPPISCFPIHDSRHIAIIEDTLDCCPCYLYKAKDVCPNELKCMTSLKAEKVLAAIDSLA